MGVYVCAASVLENAQLGHRAWTIGLRDCLEKKFIVVFGNILGEGRESTHATEWGGLVGTCCQRSHTQHMENKSLLMVELVVCCVGSQKLSTRAIWRI